jgi:hypothetical protein
LDLSIIGVSDSAVASINKTVNALNRLSKAITAMQGLNFGAQVNKLSRFFDKLALSINSINTTNIERLASVAKSLNSITKIKSLEKLDYSKVAEGFSNLTVAITPFVNKVKEAEGSLTALNGVLSKTSGKKIQGFLGGASTRQGGGLFGFARMGVSIYMMRRLARYTAELAQAGSDYLETMNLWQVAMRNNLDLADEFVNKMNKAYGVSAKTTMQAQATFKNMIGSLGDLSDETAYQLSEAITQMAFDYSSLYNVKLTQAVEKFQSALAGQVRPIRSISGYDITEKTIHALYQSIGGTKTQRQLSRTEKQLLAILAVFRQMEASGATGDLGKTLDMYANQARMMSENFIELKSWTGMLLVDLLESWGVMVKINATLITITEVVKTIAKSRGIGEKNFVDGIFESAEGANEEIDKLQGKLLDFDKFRSLSGQDEGADIAIDQKLLEAISGYTTVIDQAQNKARQLAETWLEFWLTDEDKLTPQAEFLVEVLDYLGVAIGVLIGKGFITWLGKLAVGFSGVTKASQLLNIAIVSGVIWALTEAMEAFDKGEKAAGLLYTAIGFSLVFAFSSLNAKMLDTIATKIADWFMNTGKAALAAMKNVNLLNGAMAALGVVALFIGIKSFIAAWDDMSGVQRAIGIIAALAGAIAAAAIAINVFGMNWAGALGIAALVAGGALAVTSSIKIPNYENGASDIDSGTVFRAGEFGKTEAVYTGSNGKTNVANVRQMEQAFYNALSRYGSENGGTIVVETYLDGEKVYQNTTAKAKARGNIWAKA